nr:DUF4173 domain-containing protein [Acetatifactor sp.]
MDNQGILREEQKVQNMTVVPAPKKEDTPETKRMKESFAFFGPVTFCYALFYTFCMFKNGSGVTFPFFVAASLLYLCFSLSKLGLTLKKGSVFYMVSMMLLAVSTFCTDDWRIIAFNKTGIFLLMMSLLLHQFYDTAKWNLGKYLGSIFLMVFASIGELGRPFMDAARYFKKHEGRKNKNLWYVLLGIVIAAPLLLIVIALLSSADAVFRQMADRLLKGIRIGNICNILFRICFLFFASYLLTAFLCKRTLKETVKDHRKGEPVLAITINGMLTVIYLLFSGIQIIYLFLGRMQLPEGYTYAAYAREGFFQLLAVGILNLIIVLVSLCFFRESKILKGILTVMSLCTFIMIASSALRMIIYIRFYYMTFLRILVLWALLLLFVLFVGIVISIYRESFPLFRYSTAVVTVLYLLISFAHPDYIIAAVNVANAPSGAQEQENGEWESQNSFFLSDEPYHDYSYLAGLSADAAPVLIPYLADLGYDLESFYIRGEMENRWGMWDEKWESLDEADQNRCIAAMIDRGDIRRRWSDGFGYYYLRKLQLSTDSFGIRTYNISRHMALKQIATGSAQSAK